MSYAEHMGTHVASSIRSTHPGEQFFSPHVELRKHQELIGCSAEMNRVRQLIGKAAKTPFAVLLQGESGTGKEVIARAIHRASDRASRQLVVIDCGSLVGSLMESELFGYVKGAFSGATGNKTGLVEVADGGTIFLDEIGDLPLEMQVKLLRLLQEREFRPVGSIRPQTVDVRFVAATNRDLASEVQAGRFRLDLYQRLNVFPIHLAPLRERREDIAALAEYFLGELQGLGLCPTTFASNQLRALEEHSWPGNVRELKHFIERMVALGFDGQTDVRALLQPVRPAAAVRECPPIRYAAPENQLGAPEPMSLEEGELHLISMALAATSGHRAKAAEILQISRTTLYRRLRNARAARIGYRNTPDSVCWEPGVRISRVEPRHREVRPPTPLRGGPPPAKDLF